MGKARNSHLRSNPNHAALEAETEAQISPELSTVHSGSHSGSSTRADKYHLQFPSELEPEVHPYDSASRHDPNERPHGSRSNSSRRENPHHRRANTAPQRRPRPPVEDSSSESGDSAENFIESEDYGGGMPRPQSYYGPNGYTQSSSSGSYGYPPVPHSNQVVHYAPQQQHPPYQHPHHPYPPMTSPPPPGYPQGQGYHGDPRGGRHEGNNQGGSHYRPPYGPAAVVQYGAPQGYFPPGYPAPHQYPQYHPGGPNPYLPPFMHEWQVASHSRVASPPGDKKGGDKAPPPVQVSQDDIIQKMQELLLAANAEREAKEKERQLAIQSAEDQVAAIRKAEQERHIEEARIRAEAVRQAKEQAEAAAKAHAERAAKEQQIREEAIRAAEKAIADKIQADKEQAAREARIREEAARAALEKAAADAKAKAEQEAKEKAIAEKAAADAKSAAEKKAAEDAAAKEEAAKKAAEEAATKLKESEEAAAKAKTEAEAAQEAAKKAAPPDKKAPVRFKDAIGRNYNFPWERCCKWRDMENLIIQAFQHIEDLGEHVINGRYDLIGPDKEIIMPQYWDYIIQPDMHVTMMLWPLPEPKAEIIDAGPLGGPLGGDIFGEIGGDILGGDKKKKDKGKKPVTSGIANWMLGGAIKPRKPAKKPPAII